MYLYIHIYAYIYILYMDIYIYTYIYTHLYIHIYNIYYIIYYIYILFKTLRMSEDLYTLYLPFLKIMPKSGPIKKTKMLTLVKCYQTTNFIWILPLFPQTSFTPGVQFGTPHCPHSLRRCPARPSFRT